MWPSNALFYLVSQQIDLKALAAALLLRPFQSCTGLEWSSVGWAAPAGADDFVLHAPDRALIHLKREEKLLPASVVRDHVNAKVQDFEDKELRKVGRKEKQAIKEQITDDLLPRAFSRSGRTAAYIDNKRGLLVVDASAASRAETLISELREGVAGFPAKLPKTVLSPSTAMTAWLADGAVGNGFELDDKAHMQAPGEEGARIQASRIDLTADEIRQHIANGKQVTQIGLIWRERIRFVLTDTLQLKRIQFLDVLQEDASQAGDDIQALAAATFLLYSTELGELFADLVEALGGYQED